MDPKSIQLHGPRIAPICPGRRFQGIKSDIEFEATSLGELDEEEGM